MKGAGEERKFFNNMTSNWKTPSTVVKNERELPFSVIILTFWRIRFKFVKELMELIVTSYECTATVVSSVMSLRE